MDKISVIIPCRNEERFISLCLDSVIKNDYPKEFLEVFVIDGDSTDGTRDIVESYTERFSFIHLMINKDKTVPYAMNMGIRKASGRYVVRLDAHGEIPENYFSELVGWSRKLNADNVGARWKTEVKNKNPKSLAIQKVLVNKFGVGNSYFRTGVDEVKEVDTVPFGCFRRETLEKVGLYDIRLTRNQDIELNKRIKRNNGKIFLLPHLFSIYYARENFSRIAKNNYQTGLWNLLTIYYTKNYKSLSLRHLIPLFFLLSLIIPAAAAIWFPFLGFISLASLTAYIISVVIVSLSIKEKKDSLYYILIAFVVLHFSYGTGSLLGLFRIDLLFKDAKK